MSKSLFDRIDIKMNLINEREMIKNNFPPSRMKRDIFRAGVGAGMVELAMDLCPLCVGVGLPVKIVVGDVDVFVHTKLTQVEVDKMSNYNDYKSWSKACSANNIFQKFEQYDKDFKSCKATEDMEDKRRDDIKRPPKEDGQSSKPSKVK